MDFTTTARTILTDPQKAPSLKVTFFGPSEKQFYDQVTGRFNIPSIDKIDASQLL